MNATGYVNDVAPSSVRRPRKAQRERRWRVNEKPSLRTVSIDAAFARAVALDRDRDTRWPR